jgi:hypothetical protein
MTSSAGHSLSRIRTINFPHNLLRLLKGRRSVFAAISSTPCCSHRSGDLPCPIGRLRAPARNIPALSLGFSRRPGTYGTFAR